MLRGRSLLPALMAAALLVGPQVSPADAAAPPLDDPLSITIDSLTPAVIPSSGSITITGTVTNESDETWAGINIYPVASTVPMTTAAELEAAVAADPELPIGERDIDISDKIDALAPGQSATYALRMPRDADLFGSAPGVYWLGVHALGQSEAELSRDKIADGRARTLIPKIGKTDERVDTALVLQLRRRLAFTPDGKVANPERWATDLAPTGRLRAIVELGAAAGNRPLTWLIDPAVVDAANQLMAGNPSRLPEPVDDTETPEPTPPQSTDPAQPPTPAGEGDSPLAADPGQVRDYAETWLARFQQAIAGHQLLALPYGDVDASAAAHDHQDLLVDARAEASTAFTTMGIVTSAAEASPNGFLSPEAIAAAPADDTLVVSSRSVPQEGIVEIGPTGRRLYVASDAAISGGPGPDDPLAPVAMRQRLISEAAVRLLSDDEQPLIAVLPNTWTSSELTGFYAGLDQDWLDLKTLAELDTSRATDVPESAIEYPEHQASIELDEVNLDAAAGLRGAGTTLQSVLPAEVPVGSALAREAYASSSYANRATPNTARAAATRSREWVEQLLDQITITTPPSHTLSGTTGRFPASVHNGLDYPVTVHLRASSDPGLEVEVPESIRLDPDERLPLRLTARASELGTHNLTLTLTSADGTPLGSSVEVPVRSNEVSQLIWLVMGAGGVILFGVGGVRTWRKHRRTRRTNGAPG